MASKVNPIINFKLELIDLNRKSLDERFKILDTVEGNIIQRNLDFKKNVSDFDISIVYECEENNTNCSIPEDIKKNMLIFFQMEYDSFKLYNQDKSNPLQKKSIL